MSTPTDWAQFYPQTTSDPTGPPPAQSPSHPAAQSNIEGRVGKSNRRRTRVSRRAPTTLLNTDPTNFRAMVQQFTGAPAGPYSGPNGPVINFGFGDPMQQQQQQQQAMPAVTMGQYQGQQRYDGRVTLPGGNVSDGFVQGFNTNGGGGSNVVDSNYGGGGVFFDGMMMGSSGNNERGGGYFL